MCLYRKRNIIERGELLEQRGDLERARKPEPAPAMNGKSGNVDAVETDAAVMRDNFAAEQADERGLTGSVRTDYGMHFARRDIERDRICCDHTGKASRKAFSLQECSSHSSYYYEYEVCPITRRTLDTHGVATRHFNVLAPALRE